MQRWVSEGEEDRHSQSALKYCGYSDAPRVRTFTNVLATIASATLKGAVGRPDSIEVHVSNGFPGFTIVGLSDASVREARDRVRAAILSSGLS